MPTINYFAVISNLLKSKLGRLDKRQFSFKLNYVGYEKRINLKSIAMLIVNLQKLNKFSKQHSDARKSINAWIQKTEAVIWKNKQDVLTYFPNARMIKNNRARFEIKHNAYRLIVFINYDASIVVIRFIGTHADYDKIDPETI